MNLLIEKLTSVGDPMALGGLLLLPIILVLGAVITCWAVYWDFRKKRLQYEERRQMIDKCISPPILAQPNPWGTSSEETKQRRLQLQYEERRLMIEKGMTPPALSAEDPFAKKPWAINDYLRYGTVTFFAGVGCVVSYFFLSPGDGKNTLAFIGPTLTFVGAGFLVYYFVARNTKSTESAAPPRPGH